LFPHVGLLTYAGDDGGAKGQAYRLALDADAGVARFRFRCPDEMGVWRWRKEETLIAFPACLKERLSDGKLMAPTLREERRADGERFAVLDFIIEGTMEHWICVTCGSQFAAREAQPEACPICNDQRQYVGYNGQQSGTPCLCGRGLLR
jgi:hypothetical protein